MSRLVAIDDHCNSRSALTRWRAARHASSVEPTARALTSGAAIALSLVAISCVSGADADLSWHGGHLDAVGYASAAILDWPVAAQCRAVSSTCSSAECVGLHRHCTVISAASVALDVSVAPNNSFKPNPLRYLVQMCRCSIATTHRLSALRVGLIQALARCRNVACALTSLARLLRARSIDCVASHSQRWGADCGRTLSGLAGAIRRQPLALAFRQSALEHNDLMLGDWSVAMAALSVLQCGTSRRYELGASLHWPGIHASCRP